jgi:hypothetical protein
VGVSTVIETRDSDYRSRVELPRAAWVADVAAAAEATDYSNFKGDGRGTTGHRSRARLPRPVVCDAVAAGSSGAAFRLPLSLTAGFAARRAKPSPPAGQNHAVVAGPRHPDGEVLEILMLTQNHDRRAIRNPAALSADTGETSTDLARCTE